MNTALIGLLAAATCGAGVDVRVGANLTLDIDARGASLSSVLECLSDRAGFKMVIEPGVATRQPVKVNLSGRTSTQAVLAILDGQPLNYAYTTDSTGSRVILLMISGRTDRIVTKDASKETAPAASSGSPKTRPGSRPEPPVVAPVVPAESEPALLPDPSNPPEIPPLYSPLYPEPRPISPLTLRDAQRVHVASARPPGPATTAGGGASRSASPPRD